MFKFRETLFLPKTAFPMKAELVKKQSLYQDWWRESRIYEKRLKLNESKPLFKLLDGPPFANGAIHMGHALNKVLKDFVVRWRNLTGFNSPFQPGWDMHGLPIENRLERELPGFKSLPPLEKMRHSLSLALSQVEIQAAQLSRLNLSFPLSSRYLTSSSDFVRREYSLLESLWSEGLIYRENKPVAWSYSSETALAESELNYEEVECESIYFSWRIVSPASSDLVGSNLILWTTTPYSLEANLAVAFHPKLSYSLFEYMGERFISSSEFLAQVGELFSWEASSVRLLRSLSQEELKGLFYLNNLTKEVNPVLPATFLLEGKGSGLVHMAPGLGEEDYLVCREYNIQPYCLIDEKGNFRPSRKFPPISGKFYLEASGIIVEYLRKESNLIAVRRIKHKIGKDWRTGLPTFYRSTKQWFLDLKKLQKKLEKVFERPIPTNPEWLFSKLKETLFSRSEWCLSRQRSWGLPIPVIFKNGEVFGGTEQLSRNISILVEEGIESWHSRPLSYFLGFSPSPEEEGQFSRCSDVLDVWFDSGCAFLTHYLGEETLPAELYLEGSDQLRGWFNSSAILFSVKKDSLPFKRLVSHGFILDSNGNKMSKSRGNVIDPLEVISKYGAELFRLWVANSNYLKDLRFSESQLVSIEAQYRKLRNVLFRFSLSVLPTKLDWESITLSSLSPVSLESKYIYNLFLDELYLAKTELEKLNFYKFVKSFSDFVELYSSWYLEIVKPILYSRGPEDPLKKEILSVISVVFKYSLLTLSSFLPQTTEEVYQFLSFEGKKESIWLEELDLSGIEFQDTSNRKEWVSFFELREKVLTTLEREYSEKRLSSSREASLYIPSRLIEETSFKLGELAWLLGVAEVNSTQEEEIRVSRSSKEQCRRCLLYFRELSLETIEEEEYQLCSFCLLSKKDWKKQGERGVA